MYHTIPPAEALRRLTEGNRRYAADESPESMHAHAVRRRHLIAEQRPFAIVLGCSDSRVPIEIVFNQTLGDLFVVRIAGNILNDHVIGSIEYAIEKFGSSLVLVLGHSNCGAVTAAVEAVEKHEQPRARIATIVDAIRPCVDAARGQDDIIEAAVAENVRSITATLQQSQPIIADARGQGTLAVVGAEYHLASGLVSTICGDVAESATRSADGS